MSSLLNLPGIGDISGDAGFSKIERTSDGRFQSGQQGVQAIVTTGDKKVEFVDFGTHTPVSYTHLAFGESSIIFSPVKY